MDGKDFIVERLGDAKIPSPLTKADFIADDAAVAYPTDMTEIQSYLDQGLPLPSFQKAGPREKLFHDPAWSKAAILTAGGLCPGLNDVIKSLTRTLRMQYKVPMVYGIRYGYRGLIPDYQYEPIILTEEVVDNIHEWGGSILSSSRGRQDEGKIVDTLVRMNINLLFCIGGDGTLRCAHE